MKKQKKYILLTAVLLIWGILGYQFYSRMNPSVSMEKVAVYTSNFKRAKTSTTSFYELKKAYRDPFTGKLPYKKKTKRKKVTPPKDPVIFPSIVYNGIIETGRLKSYIVTINGQQEMIKIGAETQGVKVVKANSKRIIVRFQGEKKTIVLE